MDTKMNSRGILDPAKVMMCFDHQNILDEKYGLHLSTVTGLRGYDSISRQGQIHNLLLNTYWYRKYHKVYGISKLLSENEKNFFQGKDKKAIKTFKEKIKQILFTLDNMLTKKMLAFGPEISGYAEIAQQTARCFRELLIDYTISDRQQLKTESFFEESQDFFNTVKQYHDHEDLNKRLGVLDYSFQNKSLGSFYGKELRRLKNKVTYQSSIGLGDFTTSVNWNFRFVNVLQTRTLGYVPRFKAMEKIDEFWKVSTRPVQAVPVDKLKLIHHGIIKELSEAEVPKLMLAKEEFAKEVSEAIILELKATASYTSTVKEGGKLEDARRLLEKVRQHKWRAPIRDLDTFRIIGFCQEIDKKSSLDDKMVLDLSSIIFWTSLQMMVNYMIEIGVMDGKFRFPFYINRVEHIDRDVLNAKLLGINEPGKIRMLIKSHPYLNWSLTVGSKISQKCLAKHPDHKAGLELGSHDWNHEKRISGESAEARGLYQTDGRIRPEVWMAYSDLTQATDFMTKRAGVQALKTFFGYIAFPKEYGYFILKLIRLPQICEEVVMLSEIDKEEQIIRKGMITEGFMMGNQMTKTILHLSHVATGGLVRRIMEKRGFSYPRVHGRTYRPGIPFSVEGGVKSV
jgi:hypothetical protein